MLIILSSIKKQFAKILNFHPPIVFLSSSIPILSKGMIVCKNVEIGKKSALKGQFPILPMRVEPMQFNSHRFVGQVTADGGGVPCPCHPLCVAALSCKAVRFTSHAATLAGVALYVHLVDGSTLFIIRQANVYLVVCVLMHITLH